MTTVRARVSFDRADIERSPDRPGVYILFRGRKISFIGSGESIRDELERHERGEGGTLTRHTTSYWFEQVGAPAHRVAREVDLLNEYKSEHAFNLPAGNRSQSFAADRRS